MPSAASSASSCNAATEVNQAILFAAAIIIAGFVPLFTLSGIEGHIFGPMAKTYGYAIAGGLIGHVHHLPGIECAAADGQHCGDGDLPGARAAPCLRAGGRVCAGEPGHHPGRARCPAGTGSHRAAWTRTGISAQARGGQLLDPRHHADVHLARGGQCIRQPHAPHDQQLPGGADGDLAAWPAR